MTRICPKCSYIRKLTDEAPEWQCPSCQVAYIKASGEPVSTNYGRYGAPVIKNKPASSGTLKWVIVVAVLGAGVLLGKPLWSHKQPVAAVASTSQPEVTLYATEWCGYCAATREMFDKNGIAYKELDVEKSTAGYEGHKKLNGNGVPLIVIGDEIIRGYNEEKIRSSLQPWFHRDKQGV